MPRLRKDGEPVIVYQDMTGGLAPIACGVCGGAPRKLIKAAHDNSAICPECLHGATAIMRAADAGDPELQDNVIHVAIGTGE